MKVERQAAIEVRAAPSGARKAGWQKRQIALAREAFWEGLPEIVTTLVLQATQGNIAAVKQLLDLHGMGPGALAVTRKPRMNPLEARLLKEWAAEDDARRAAEAAADDD